MRGTLLELTASLKRSISLASLVVSGVSGWISFQAYREFLAGTDMSPIVAEATAGATAMAAATLLHVTYCAILGAVPVVDRLARRQFIPIIGGLMISVSLFSTYTNVITTAGNDALRIHAARTVDRLIRVGADVQGLTLAAGQLVPDLAERAARFHADAQCEAERGCLSGTPGVGELTDALLASCNKVASVGAALDSAQVQIAELMLALNEAFRHGDEISIRGLLAEMRGKIPVTLLKSMAADLRGGIGIEGRARNKDVRARQNEVIEQLQRELASVAEALDAMATRLEEQSSNLELPVRETITKAGAVWRYAGELVPQIALGVALDWTLVLAAFFMGRIRDAIPRPEDDVSDISLAEARRNHRELQRLIRDVISEDGGALAPQDVEPDPEMPTDPEPGKAPDNSPPWREEDDPLPRPRVVIPFPEAAE
jgi:hypothetical protein